jgi:formate hydrogenlyase subunit 3/multisubunit Na+/H+ antiporter MnhD subunit
VNSLFLTLDLFNIYVTLELISIAGVGLILVAGTAGATRAALQYQMQTLVAGLVYLLGVGLVYNATGTLDLHLLRDHLQPGPLKNTGMALMTAGLLVKAALFPVHFWLPRAHADAPAPVSAVLSGLVVTTAFVVMSKLWFAGLRVLAPEPMHLFIGGLGAAGILWGGILALRQRRLKRILAYSTVSQVGYLFLVFALTFRNAPDPGRLWAGAVYLAISHGLAKAAAFMAAGVLAQAEGSDRLSTLRGAAFRQPGAVLVLAAASVNLMGLPPSLGFVGKWWMLTTALQTGQWGLAAILLAGGLLSGIYLFRVFETLFRPGDPVAHPSQPRSTAAIRGMLIPAAGLAIATLLPALFLSVPNRMLSIGGPVLHSSPR